MVDRELVRRRLTMLDTYLGDLRRTVPGSVEEYLGDRPVQLQVERLLQLAMEVCLDMADHVVADHRLQLPQTAADTFAALGRAQILATPLADSLVTMARFRNLLVHGYADLDHRKVYEAATIHVRDIQLFRDQMLRITDERADEQGER